MKDVAATRGREPEIDPAWELMPKDQIERVLGQEMCDIDASFLGFTDIYLALAKIIPTFWTIIDLGCAYAPQAIIFSGHKAYIGVDLGEGRERFSAPNTTHYNMTNAEFVEKHATEFDQELTFAICSYVPPWYDCDSLKLARETFRNVFTYYPGPDPSWPKWPDFDSAPNDPAAGG